MPVSPSAMKRSLVSLAVATVAGIAGIAGISAMALQSAPSSPPPAENAGPAPSPPPSLTAEIRARAATLRDEALRGTRAYEIARSLVVEVGPRPAGSKADAAAVEWALRKMKELGFANVRAEKVTVPHWVRGQESGRILAPYPQPVVLAALGGSVGTTDEGIEAEVIEAASVEALDALDPARVRGKIVFLNVRMERTRDEKGYGDAVPARSAGPSHAARLGAVAVLIRSIGTDRDRVPHTGGTRYEEGVPRIPAAALSNPDADLLAAQVASGKPVTFRLKLGSRLLGEAESANVIGEVRGRERPEEIVLIACHLDSWDLGTGALDDAAGCGIVAEAARRIAPLRPRRTIRVVFFANEEFGLSGARAYAEAHAGELAKHVLAAESDFGAGRVWRLRSRVAPAALPFVGQLAELLRPLGVEQGDNNESSGGADLIPLQPAHVPVLAFGQDATHYFDWHHTANDTLDKIDPKELDQNVAAWAAVIYAAAETPGTFGPAPDYVPEP
ncbi:MAG TPA: M20/M25/M40 family metallo-hydrolase [Thermoanaerobaculia bacterium]|nr:M20/M25/M40 family metallo-hydrolase [Thermoanaerobaculia bacterium]